MTIRPWAIGGKVINDGESGTDEAWVSALLDGAWGLEKSPTTLAQRYGRNPLLAGGSLSARTITLRTLWETADLSIQEANKIKLLAIYAASRTALQRLVATEYVLPGVATDDVLLALGPWDVYCTDAGTWYVRDLLDPDNVEATLTGAVHFEDTDTAPVRAIVIEEATTNYLLDQVFGHDTLTDYWNNNGWDTFAYATSTDYTAGQALHLVDAAGSVSCYSDDVADADGGETWTATARINVVSGTLVLGIQENNGGWTTKDTVSTSGTGWQTISISAELTAGVTDGRVIIRCTAACEGYVDWVQFEEKDAATSLCWGGKGPGYAWNGTPHESSSTRTVTELNLDSYADTLSDDNALAIEAWVQAPFGVDETWNNTFPVIFSTYADASNYIRLRYNVSSKYFYLQINGSAISNGASALTFAAGDWLHVVATLDFAADTYYVYVNGEREVNDTTSLAAPTGLDNMNIGSLYDAAQSWNGKIAGIRVYDRVLTTTEIAALYAEGYDFRARWLDVRCASADLWMMGNVPSDRGIVATLDVDNDARWRSRDGDVAFLRIYGESDSIVIDNQGDDDAYPTFYITPTEPRTDAYLYKVFIPIVWQDGVASFTNYPIDIVNNGFDTDALVTAGKMQADGDDLRVWVDGTEVDRWLQDINTVTTQVWVNMNFSEGVAGALSANIGAGDTVTSISSTTSIEGVSSSGILLINSEVFTYTSINVDENQFLGVTRAAKGTSAGAHTAADVIYWIQHDVWILYGNATATAPTVDDDYKPIIELTSTNTSWVYQEFGADDGLRTGAWTQYSGWANEDWYTANRGTDADPWEELGVYKSGRWYLYNPCYITNVNFTNGEKYATDTAAWTAATYKSIMSAYSLTGGWFVEDTIAAPAVGSNWESWSDNEAITANRRYVALFFYVTSGDAYLEVADVTVTLNSSYTPVVSIGSEQSNYDLACTIENETTGDSLELALTMEEDETVIVNTDEKTLTYQGAGQLQALTLTGGARQDWLRLARGENVITYTATGNAGTEIDIVWTRRYF